MIIIIMIIKIKQITEITTITNAICRVAADYALGILSWIGFKAVR